MSIDNLVLDESINNDMSESEFIKKEWLYVNDQNGQSYQSQLNIDTTTLSNCGAYQNISEGFLVIPLVVTLTSVITPPAVETLPASTQLGNFTWDLRQVFGIY